MSKSEIDVPPAEEEEEEEYVVEKILRHKTKNNVTLYFLKWKNFPDEDNTWEPATNLNCPELIEEYEKSITEKKKKLKEAEKAAKSAAESSEKKQLKRKQTGDSTPKKKKKSEKRTGGFDRGLEAEEILGATETAGEVHFLIKWKGLNDAELVPAKVTNVQIPQKVIAFYEARLTWSSGASKETESTNPPDEASPKKKSTEAA